MTKRGCWFLVRVALVGVIAVGTEGTAGAESSETYQCTLEAWFDRLGDGYYIPVKGVTSLPDRALLRVGAYYVKPASEIFRRPDRPPPPPDLLLLDETDIVLEGGRFEARLWIIRRVPYPGTYRVRALLRWPDQPVFLQGKNPEDRDPLEWSVDIVQGTPEDLEQERASARKEVKADLDRLVALQKEMGRRFRLAINDRASAEAWGALCGTMRGQLAAMEERNARRLEVGVIWTETQGKYRVQDLSERLVLLSEACSRALEAHVTAVPPEVAEQERAFRAIYEGALNLLGFIQPVDPDLVREHLGPIVEDFGRIERFEAVLRESSSSAQAEALVALRDGVIDRLRAGFGALLPVGPEQAVEPATRYTEAITGFFEEATAIAGGHAARKDAARKQLEKARDSLRALRELVGG